MGRTLLMADEDLAEVVLMIVQRVEDRHDASPRIAKDGGHAFVDESLHERLCAGYLIFHTLIICLTFNELFLWPEV